MLCYFLAIQIQVRTQIKESEIETYLDPQPCLDGLVDGLKHPVVSLAARYELELRRDERVEADVDRVQAGLPQAGKLAAQGQPVCRYSDGSKNREGG